MVVAAVAEIPPMVRGISTLLTSPAFTPVLSGILDSRLER
jgi:hypothetical protein